jgi:hypothetical protein
VHYLSSPCTLSPLVVHSLSRLCTSIHPLRLLSAFIPSVHHVHLDPSIAALYLLRYSTADPLNSLSTFRANPPIVQVGHYGQSTVTVPEGQKGMLVVQQCHRRGEGSTHWGAARLAPLPSILHYLHIVPSCHDEGGGITPPWACMWMTAFFLLAQMSGGTWKGS